MFRVAERILIFNEQFDRNVLNSEAARRYDTTSYLEHQRPKIRCAMLTMASVMKIPGRYGDYKWPKLEATYEWLYKEKFVGAHGAIADARATGWMAWSVVEMGLWEADLISDTNIK
jgi:hypothetical protein